MSLEAIQAEGLHRKFDDQLADMLESHSAKLPRVQKDLRDIVDYPDFKRKELRDQFEEEGLESLELYAAIEDELSQQFAYYMWKVGRLQEVVALIAEEQELRAQGKVVRKPTGTTYYCDPSLEPATITGTWEFTNASANITTGASADGNAVAEVAVNDWIKLSDGTQWYKIKTVTDDDNLILDTTFRETTHTDDANATVLSQPDVEDGSTTAKAWPVLTLFTENGRSAGDKLIVKRGTIELCSEGGSDLNFTSDGSITNPIIIEADYGNTWSGNVDLSATGTATLTFGSKTITFSADISGVLSANDWIYVTAEAAKDWAYEVETVSTVTVTLYLPYKGAQAGAGKAMTNMGAAPIWNTVAGAYEVNFDSDFFWKIQGLYVTGDDTNGVIEFDGCTGHEFKDCIIVTNGSSNDMGVFPIDSANNSTFRKSRLYDGCGLSCRATAGRAFGITFKDCLFDGNNVADSAGVDGRSGEGHLAYFHDCEFKNYGSGDIVLHSTANQHDHQHRFYLRNCLLSSGTPVDRHDINYPHMILFEDYGQTPGDTRQLTGFSTAEGTPSIQSEATTVRAGGSTKSIKVTPSDKLSSTWELSRIKIFDLPIYATTSEKTYTVYFKSSGTGNWTADPLNTELWIELEAWGHATNNHRKITKSTGVCDFNGDDTNWLTLAVTVTPAQAGVAYLRCYYCKTKEDAKSNIFYVDPVPVIS